MTGTEQHLKELMDLFEDHNLEDNQSVILNYSDKLLIYKALLYYHDNKTLGVCV